MAEKRRSRGLAVVTGASSGIGRVFARQLAERGFDLVITARRQSLLEELAEEIRAEVQRRVHVVPVDLATPEGRIVLVEAVRGLGRPPRLLINNAGFGYHGEALDQPRERLEEMIELNAKAPSVLAMEFGRMMRDQRRGGIINVASMAGFQPCPNVAAYGATKAFVLSLSEALSEELRPYGVRVLALCPGVTDTAFHDVAGPPYRMHRWMHFVSPEDCVRRCLRAYEKGKVVHIDGAKNALLVLMERFAPRAFVRRLSGVMLTTLQEEDQAGNARGT